MRTYSIEHVTIGPLVPHFRVVIVENGGESSILEGNFPTMEVAQRMISDLKQQDKADEAGDAS
jgi:hypothetical protein